MKRLYYLLYPLLFLFSSCEIVDFVSDYFQEEEEIAIPILTFSKSIYNVDIDAGSFSIGITSNLTWETTNTSNWITLSPESGEGSQTITFSYEANSSTESRTATIKFFNTTYEKEAEIVITQVTPQFGDLDNSGSL